MLGTPARGILIAGLLAILVVTAKAADSASSEPSSTASPTSSPSTSPPSTTEGSSEESSTARKGDAEAESVQPGEQHQVAILKQINRVNDDGSYTFGYEAADGSFKIETRDVLGHVKGMFGYIDEHGNLKRVSYSAANGTGFSQASGVPEGAAVGEDEASQPLYPQVILSRTQE